MSEHDSLPSTSNPSESVRVESTVTTVTTAGTLLRQARQAQGVHLSVLAASLKVPVEKLEALEQDRFDLLLDAVFVRALASGVCRLLKLDPNPILQRLPAPDVTRTMPQNRGINESFRSGGVGFSFPAQLSKPVILMGVALLLGAVVLIFLPVIQQKTAGMTGKLVVPELSSKKSSSEVVSNPESATPPEAVQSAASAASNAADFTSSGVEVVPASAALGSSAAASAASNANLATLVGFSATQSSWVKVNDAKGALLLNRTLQAGESVSVSGALPLRVLVGRADVVQVQVRGQAFDLMANAKNNVARFEVK